MNAAEFAEEYICLADDLPQASSEALAIMVASAAQAERLSAMSLRLEELVIVFDRQLTVLSSSLDRLGDALGELVQRSSQLGRIADAISGVGVCAPDDYPEGRS